MKKKPRAEKTETKYICSMHSNIQQGKPGKCKKCGMTLSKVEVKVTESGIILSTQNQFVLAVKATLHCLFGCGIGEVFGVIIGTLLGLSFFVSLAIGVFAGFIFGYILGIIPLLQANMNILNATKIVLATETLSITVMETGEALTEIYFPGMMMAGLTDLIFWLGMTAALVVGFIVAFPVNLYLVRKGIRHQS